MIFRSRKLFYSQQKVSYIEYIIIWGDIDRFEGQNWIRVITFMPQFYRTYLRGSDGVFIAYVVKRQIKTALGAFLNFECSMNTFLVKINLLQGSFQMF